MTPDKNTKKSKQLSYILRHKPESIGMELDSNGWGSVELILDKLILTMEQLKGIVITNNKQRFEFDNPDNPTKIRARQGHSESLNVDVELTEIMDFEQPIVVYHATPITNIKSIKDNGLLKGNRKHVHMSMDKKTAIEAAKRRSNDVITYQITFYGDVDEPKLYKSNNNVYLAETVPYRMLKVIDVKLEFDE